MAQTCKIFIAESGSGYGGTAKYLKDLLTLLDKQTYGIQIGAAGTGPFLEEISKMGWPIYPITDWRYPASNPFFTLVRLIFRVPSIAYWLRKNKIQLVHLNNEISSHTFLILGARLAGCKILAHLHGWRPLTKLEKWASRFIDGFMSVTSAGAKFYEKELPGKSVLANPNGLILSNLLSVPPESREKFRRELGISADDILVTVVGRLVESKGQHIFLNALAKARIKNPALKGLIVGTDDSSSKVYSNRLLQDCERLGIKKDVHFLSWQSDLQVTYGASDIVVQPSIKPESFGLVALEAMAEERPVIVSRLGGLTEVVDENVTGFLVSPNDSDELALELGKLASDVGMRENMGRQGKIRAVAHFDMQRNARSVKNLYADLLGKQRAQ